jgi:hypothetical protein
VARRWIEAAGAGNDQNVPAGLDHCGPVRGAIGAGEVWAGGPLSCLRIADRGVAGSACIRARGEHGPIGPQHNEETAATAVLWRRQ